MSSSDTRVADLVDAFLDLKRAGRAPDPESFALEHPDVAPRLREALKGLAAVEEAAEQVRDTPGSAIGDYRIAREIGRGGMGVVYEAEDTKLKRRVALKVLPAAALLDPKRLQRFRHEAQAAAQLHHGNIVPVYGVGSAGGHHYYAMQFIDGVDLGTVLRDLREGARGREVPSPSPSPLSSQSVRTRQYLAAVCRLGIQAAEALDHAHQVGVVHRDVKPANLIVDASGHVWVTDFGLAQFERGSAVTRTGDLVGTFRYMSPEQAGGKRLPIDHRTDVYSLGATLYELATLEPAVPGEEPHEVLHAIGSTEPVAPRKRNPAVPAELETILLKALAKEPQERYETAQSLADDLRRFLDDRPIAARPPTVAQRARKWGRRHRGLVGAGAGVLLLAVAVLSAGIVVIAKERQKTAEALGRAEESLEFARRAVDSFLTEVGVSKEIVQDLQLQTGKRKEMLEEALRFYDTFLVAHPDEQFFGNRGAILGALGRATDALAAYERVIELNPADLRAHNNRGALFRDLLGMPAQALAEFDRAIEINPKVAYVHCNRGRALVSLGRVQEALEEYDRAAELDPRDPTPHSCRGTALRTLDRWDEALAAYRRAAELDPSDAGASINVAAACMSLGRHAEALAASDRAILLDPTYAGAHANRSSALFELGRPDEALVAIDRAIELDPTDPLLLRNRAATLAPLGRFDEALPSLDHAIELDPANSEFHCMRARVLSAVGRQEEALVAYDQAIAVDPKSAGAHRGRGATLAALGRSEEALAAYDLAIQLDPSNCDAHHGRGAVLHDQLHRPLDALAEFERAVALAPGSVSAHHDRGIALESLGRLEEAVAAWERAIQLDPRKMNVRLLRAQALEQLGRAEAALAAYEECVALGPGDPALMNRAAWVYLTCEDPRWRKPDRAVQLAKIATKLAPADGNYWNTLGIALNRAGRLVESIDALNRSMELRDGGNAYDWFFVAMAKRKLGHADAREWLEKAVAWTEQDKPDDPVLKRFRAEAEELFAAGE